MRHSILISNSLVGVFFVGFLTYTFVAKNHIESLAKEFVTEKTIAHSKSLVDLAEKSLDSRLATVLLSDSKESEIRSEITQYRNDPHAYVVDLTSQQDGGVFDDDGTNDENGSLSQAISSVKNRIRKFYDEALSALIDDLRIFAISNLVASLIAFGLVFKSNKKLGESLIVLSAIILFSVLYSSFLYVNELTFFRILFRLHLGWNYALFLAFMVIAATIQFAYQMSANKLTSELSRDNDVLRE